MTTVTVDTPETTTETTEITLTLPVTLVAELEALIPEGQQQQFLIDLLEWAVWRKRFKKALDESAGAWTDENHPDLKTAADIEAYVRRLRDSWLPRSWDEIIAEGRDE